MAFSLSDYSDFREIGRGGMGKVFLATQRSLGRNVVIKEMMTGLVADATQIKRFENEARSAAALSHPNVIRVYDFGPDRDSFYIVMEYVDGPDLEQLLARQDIPREVSLMVTLQALKGLHYAHEHGIIHRDVKPGNVLVSSSGEAKIMDFGLAHAGSMAVHLTASEAIVGTPQYMSPEQANGVEQKSLRMDVFSAGVLLYRVVSGRLPFSGNTIPSLLYNITQNPEPPLLELVPAINEELSRAIHAALVKDPEKRSDSLSPLITALQKYFYELAIPDPVAAVHRCLSNPQAGSYELCQRLIDHNLKKARDFAGAGVNEKAKAHLEQVLRYDPHNAEAVQVGHDITGGTTVLRVMRGQAPSPEAAIMNRRREQRAPWLGATVVAFLFLVVGVGSWMALRLTKPRPVAPVVAVGDTVVAPIVPAVPPIDSAAIADSILAAVADSVAAATPDTKPAVRTTAKPKTAGKGRVRLHVEPTTATVLVDGRKVSGTSGDFDLRLTEGKHKLKISADGFEPYGRLLAVRGTQQSLDIVLPGKQVTATTGTLHIHTYPWAELFVDGRYVGNTPTAAPLVLTAGKHSVVLTRAGYEQREMMVDIKAGQHRSESLKLAPLTPTSVPSP